MIPAGESMTATIRPGIDESGTYFYHAHHGFQDHSVFGPLIVRDRRDPLTLGYDDERIVMLSDWWHADTESMLTGLLSSPVFRFIGEPQSLLVNGRGQFGKCQAAEGGNGSIPQPKHFMLQIEPRKTYRLR